MKRDSLILWTVCRSISVWPRRDLLTLDSLKRRSLVWFPLWLFEAITSEASIRSRPSVSTLQSQWSHIRFPDSSWHPPDSDNMRSGVWIHWKTSWSCPSCWSHRIRSWVVATLSEVEWSYSRRSRGLSFEGRVNELLKRRDTVWRSLHGSNMISLTLSHLTSNGSVLWNQQTSVERVAMGKGPKQSLVRLSVNKTQKDPILSGSWDPRLLGLWIGSFLHWSWQWIRLLPGKVLSPLPTLPHTEARVWLLGYSLHWFSVLKLLHIGCRERLVSYREEPPSWLSFVFFGCLDPFSSQKEFVRRSPTVSKRTVVILEGTREGQGIQQKRSFLFSFLCKSLNFQVDSGGLWLYCQNPLLFQVGFAMRSLRQTLWSDPSQFFSLKILLSSWFFSLSLVLQWTLRQHSRPLNHFSPLKQRFVFCGQPLFSVLKNKVFWLEFLCSQI